jgi:hypothetical protein
VPADFAAHGVTAEYILDPSISIVAYARKLSRQENPTLEPKNRSKRVTWRYFFMENEDSLREEKAPEICRWLDAVKNSWASSYYFPNEDDVDHLGRIISEEKAIERGFVIVPMPDIWAPWEDEGRTISILKSRGYQRLYGTGLLYKEGLHLSAVVNGDEIRKLLVSYMMYCVITSREEDFVILNTNFEYWLLAGPESLVSDILGNSIENAFNIFVATAVTAAEPYDEPGPKFAADIASRCQRHNKRITGC